MKHSAVVFNTVLFLWNTLQIISLYTIIKTSTPVSEYLYLNRERHEFHVYCDISEGCLVKHAPNFVINRND